MGKSESQAIKEKMLKDMKEALTPEMFERLNRYLSSYRNAIIQETTKK